MIGLCARNRAFRAQDILLAALDCGLRFIDLRHQFGDIQVGQHLAFAHPVANIDIDVPDITGHLGMKFHLLVGQQLACNLKPV